MSYDDLFQQFRRDFVALDEGQPIFQAMTRTEAWCVMSTIQLACRHPEFAGPTRLIAERVARELQAQLAITPALIRVAEMGWDPSADVE